MRKIEIKLNSDGRSWDLIARDGTCTTYATIQEAYAAMVVISGVKQTAARKWARAQARESR